MTDQGNIPTLTDLIEKGIEIKMSELGLEDDLQFGVDDDGDDFDITDPDLGETSTDPITPAPATSPADPLADDPVLEQAIRRILDEHMELALQEIRLAIQRSRRGG